MVHLRPVILALLLALAAPVAAVPSSAPSAQDSVATSDIRVYAPENTSAILTLGEDADETRAFVRPSLDLGTTLAIQKDAMNRRLSSDSFETQLSGFESESAKRDLIFKYATQTQSRTEALEQREQNARQGFRDGSLSALEYVRTLARINEEAERLRIELDLIEMYTKQIQFPLNEYLGILDKRLLSLQGPIRDDTVEVMNGKTSPNRIYVETAENGVVQATIRDGVYVRSIYRSDLRNLKTGGNLNSTKQEDFLSNSYPWAMGANNKGWGLNEIWDSSHYSYFVDHKHGEISGVLDMGTEQMFIETQRKYLTRSAVSRHQAEATTPKGPSVTANESGLLLTVNRSYPGGPMYVALQDNETGEFVEGTVAIDGETVGQTSADGGLWTLSPAGSFHVSASSGLDVVTVGTRATRPIKNYNTSER